VALPILKEAEATEMPRLLIDEFRGKHGLRDSGLREAAVYRRQNGCHDDLIHEAAALVDSLANNHPFLDGDKRISLAVPDTLLRINGYLLEVEALTAHQFITEAIRKKEFGVRQNRERLPLDARPLTGSRDPPVFSFRGA
jgi:death-on-curing protein